MTTPSTDTHSSMVACPPLEDIAAFIDGINLSPEERARITEHLARCESCYEIFAGAVHFQEEDEEEEEEEEEVPVAAAYSMPAVKKVALPADPGGVLPFPLAQEKSQETKIRVEPTRPPRRVSQWLPLAASVVLTVGLGFVGWRLFAAPPEITLAGAIEPIAKNVQGSGDLYDNTKRGLPKDSSTFLSAPSVMIGVHAIDLRLSVQAGDVEATGARLQAIGGELQDILLVSPEIFQRYQARSSQMRSSEDLDRFRAELPTWEKDLQGDFEGDVAFQFGLWAEAGRLAAVTKAPDFFESRNNRRFLSHALKVLPAELGEDLGSSVGRELESIERIWDGGTLSSEGYGKLASHFRSIIDRIDDYEEFEAELPLDN